MDSMHSCTQKGIHLFQFFVCKQMKLLWKKQKVCPSTSSIKDTFKFVHPLIFFKALNQSLKALFQRLYFSIETTPKD